MSSIDFDIDLAKTLAGAAVVASYFMLLISAVVAPISPMVMA